MEIVQVHLPRTCLHYEVLHIYTQAYRRQLLSMARPESDQMVLATSCTLYPCPPATPATLYEKPEEVLRSRLAS